VAERTVGVKEELCLFLQHSFDGTNEKLHPQTAPYAQTSWPRVIIRPFPIQITINNLLMDRMGTGETEN
jgi:hypothetical protein